MCAYDPQVGYIENEKETFWEHGSRAECDTGWWKRDCIGGYLNWHIRRSKEGRKRWTPEQATPRIKWWRLKGENPKIKFRETVLEKVRPVESVQEWREERSTMIFRVRQEVLRITAGRWSPWDKETWWWNDKVQDVIKAKKEARKMWETAGRQEGRDSYRQANKAAKTAVAQPRRGQWMSCTRSWKHQRVKEIHIG